MHMIWIDWLVAGMVLVLFITVSVLAGRLSRSVSDFLVAGRSVGRYMLTIASGMEWIGAINIVAMFQLYYTGGFPCMWWVMLSQPLIVYMCVSGWGVYRFRETRSMTIAQFLETRYSRGVRLTAGVLSWTAGMINFGVFPLVSARLFIAIIGLPEHFMVLGLRCSTFVVLSGLMVAVPLGIIVVGGHTSVIVSNFVQGLFTNVAAVIIVGVLMFSVFHWHAIVGCLIAAGKPDASLLDPIRASATKDFNVWYFLISIVGAWYSAVSNVPAQGFLGSGKTAHEQRMGYLLAQINWQGLLVFFMVIVLCAFQLLHDPSSAGVAAKIMHSVKAMPESAQSQVLVPSALPYLLPAGLVGLFFAVMVAALLSSQNGFMHAWGGVLLQDIILPLRRRPLGTRAHLWALRGAIATVGLIAFGLSCTFHPRQSLLMLFAAINNIWLGPAGAVILGGLYWKRGTARAAMSTLLVGSGLGLVLFGCQQLWPVWHHNAAFPIDGQWMFLITIVFSTVLYVGVSLIEQGESCDMNKLLHRGERGVEEEALAKPRPLRWWQTIFGITPMFNLRDRLTAYLIVGWFLIWLVVFGIGTTYGCVADPGQAAWAKFWQVYIYISCGLLVSTTLWLGIGGLRDVRNLVRSLRASERDFRDDGRVRQENGRTPTEMNRIATAPAEGGLIRE